MNKNKIVLAGLLVANMVISNTFAKSPKYRTLVPKTQRTPVVQTPVVQTPVVQTPVVQTQNNVVEPEPIVTDFSEFQDPKLDQDTAMNIALVESVETALVESVETAKVDQESREQLKSDLELAKGLELESQLNNTEVNNTENEEVVRVANEVKEDINEVKEDIVANEVKEDLNEVATIAAQDKADADIKAKLSNKVNTDVKPVIKNNDEQVKTSSKFVKALKTAGYALPIVYAVAWGVYANQDLIPAPVMNYLAKSPELLKTFVNSIFLSNGQIQYGYDVIRNGIKTFIVALAAKSSSMLNATKDFGANKYNQAKNLGTAFLNTKFYNTLRYNKLAAAKDLGLKTVKLGSNVLDSVKIFGANFYDYSTNRYNVAANFLGGMIGKMFNNTKKLNQQPVCPKRTVSDLFRSNI